MEKLLKKLSFILLLILITAGGIFVLTRKPKVVNGVETFPDQGRNHIPDGTAEEYNSDPPTSGPHYAEWEKPGIYDRVLADGRLIHSLEHGYIVISYNCGKISKLKSQDSKPRLKAQNFQTAAVYAHETEEAREEIPATDNAGIKTKDVSEWKNSSECQTLVAQIKRVAEKTGMDRLIVVPRPNMDTQIALTAWTKLMKLETVNEDKITAFIKEFRNRGPEKTME